jgi:outer membrane cobalamin receptor
MNRRRPHPALSLVLLLIPLTAAATEEPTPTPTPTPTPVFRDEVTVSETPILDSNRVDEFGSLIGTVTADQIDDLNAQDLSAALRRVPGVVVSRFNPIGAFGGGDGGGIFIRGHGSGRPGSEIATFTDGVPRFVGVWTHPLLDPLTLDTTDRIDVHRSAQPVLYGNMAFGAVNMISKRRTDAGFGGRFVGSWGEHQTLVGRLEAGGRHESLDWYLTASHRASDGHRDNADGEVQAVSGRLGHAFGDHWDLTVRYEHVEGDVGDPGMVGGTPPPVDPRYVTTSDFAVAVLSHDHGAWEGSATLYLDDGTADWLQWDGGAAESFRSVTDWNNWGLRLRETVEPWAGGTLVVGLDHDVYGGEFVERRPTDDRLATDLDFRNTAPYVMVSHRFGDRVVVQPSLGVRYNDSRYFGGEWGGQAGLTVGFGKHQLYANAAHAFNLPGVWAAVQYGGWGLGDDWQNLDAETVDHLEVGWIVHLSQDVRLDLSLYSDRVENALRFVAPPPPPPSFANIGDYETRGVELSVSARVATGLTVFAGVTASDTEPDDVPNLPDTTATAGLSWATASGFRMNLDAQYLSERSVLNPRFAPGQAPVGAFTLVNGRGAMPLQWLRLPPSGELFVAVENLLDEDYEYRVGYPMPGLTWTAGVDITF